MRRKAHWAWKIYFFLYSFGILLNLLLLFYGESPISQYYRVLMVFKQSYCVQYYFYIAKVIVEALSLIPLFLFAFRVRFFPAFVWQILLGARVFLLIFGQSYEWNIFRALMHWNPTTTIAVLSLAVLFTIPSYVACAKYAFGRKRLFEV